MSVLRREAAEEQAWMGVWPYPVSTVVLGCLHLGSLALKHGRFPLFPLIEMACKTEAQHQKQEIVMEQWRSEHFHLPQCILCCFSDTIIFQTPDDC